jgi:hypothetical protein
MKRKAMDATLADVPDNLVQDMLAFATDTLESLIAVRQVCKLWQLQSKDTHAHPGLVVVFKRRRSTSQELHAFAVWLAMAAPGLRSLSFRGCWRLQDDSLEVVSRAFPRLQLLDVEDCTELTDAGLASMTVLSNLRHLNLGGLNEPTATGLAMLCHLPLQELYLADSFIDEECIPYLCLMTQLELLNLQFTAGGWLGWLQDGGWLDEILHSLSAFVFVRDEMGDEYCIWGMLEPTSDRSDENNNWFRESTPGEGRPPRYTLGGPY